MCTQTASIESITVENIGAMERCPVAVSCHGDVMRAQGFCELLGSMEVRGETTLTNHSGKLQRCAVQPIPIQFRVKRFCRLQRL